MVPTPSTLEVRLAKRSDAGDFTSHVVRHLAESGAGGTLHFAPVTSVNREDVRADTERRWRTSVGQPGWGRAWLLWDATFAATPPDPGRRVVGHVELRGSAIPSALHRAEMSIGVERAFAGSGHGLALARAALDFARHDAALAFIDLRVLAHNQRARAFYRDLGFTDVALVEDAFRLPDGARADDVLMVLKL